MDITLPSAFVTQLETFSRRMEIKGMIPGVMVVIPRAVNNGVDEAELIGAVGDAIHGLHSFPVIVDGTHDLGDYRTLFLAVEKTPELMRCCQVLGDVFEQFLGPKEREHAHVPTPHITLASGLAPTQGRLVAQAARQIDWPKLFVCDRLELRRKTLNSLDWEVATAFHLE